MRCRRAVPPLRSYLSEVYPDRTLTWPAFAPRLRSYIEIRDKHRFLRADHVVLPFKSVLRMHVPIELAGSSIASSSQVQGTLADLRSKVEATTGT